MEKATRRTLLMLRLLALASLVLTAMLAATVIGRAQTPDTFELEKAFHRWTVENRGQKVVTPSDQERAELQEFMRRWQEVGEAWNMAAEALRAGKMPVDKLREADKAFLKLRESRYWVKSDQKRKE